MILARDFGTGSAPLALLWDYLLSPPGDVVFFVQDTAGRYQLVGRGLSGRLTNFPSSNFSDREAFGAQVAKTLVELHDWALEHRRPIIDCLLNTSSDSTPRWCLHTKFPVIGSPNKRVDTVVGYFRYLRIPVEIQPQLDNIARALEFFRNNLSQAHTLEQLAELAEMGPVKFDRRVQRILGCSTREYMIRVRMEHAKALFREPEREISAIARVCGYGNASSFARQFKNWSGVTPTEFRAELISSNLSTSDSLEQAISAGSSGPSSNSAPGVSPLLA